MDRFNGKLMLDELGTDLSVTLLGVAGLGLEMEEGTIGSFLLDFSSVTVRIRDTAPALGN